MIYDRIFESQQKVARWVKRFPVRYAVKSGEGLKSLQNFPQHMNVILQKTHHFSPKRLKIIVLGGGSVGDFGGFVASVYKRGVELISIPSTWLSAMDSAHGGKTALNARGAKNQIGTFYPAKDVYLIKPLLLAQPSERNFEALGEIIKMALISGGSLYKKLNLATTLNSASLWKLLPLVIKEKYRIVQKDPQERKGLRHVLNFGHTMGHAFEVHYELPHGVAVLAGLQFALEWSFQRGIMSQSEYLKLMRARFWKKAVQAKQLSVWKNLNMRALLSDRPQRFLRYLEQDKKKTNLQNLRFIFLKSPGSPFIDEVPLKDILPEIARQQSFWG
ncbi:MAG: 3-dehydroquinate synthase family protein [Pseudobdellovibrionaceae bacterium]